jgi:hypothetical protein
MRRRRDLNLRRAQTGCGRAERSRIQRKEKARTHSVGSTEFISTKSNVGTVGFALIPAVVRATALFLDYENVRSRTGL